jgi:hypothetical protein
MKGQDQSTLEAQINLRAAIPRALAAVESLRPLCATFIDNLHLIAQALMSAQQFETDPKARIRLRLMSNALAESSQHIAISELGTRISVAGQLLEDFQKKLP